MKANTLLSLTALALTLGACATNKSVDQKIAESQAQSSKKIESVSGQVEDLQQKQKATDTHLQQNDQAIAQLSQEAKDALKRATDAGVLAKGKVVFQQTFSEDRVKFKTNKYDLDDKGKAALDEFAGKVKALTDQYYVEIQGHTDDTGGKKLNDELGQRRAEEVRRYLSRSAQLPLNRMSTISYGDTLPVASNKTRKGRAENRRVVIIVLE
ncbi:MAG TPA: OmpA family protein [Thermoanaerobaculia bacterium]|nr:OmpA family protein [Thermoanaerobaculia bacterium]